MTRGNLAAASQKTYDDCHLVCSTAIYFESKKDEAEALRCWKNARDQIAYHNAVRLPSNYTPKTETEKALSQSLRQLELQCRERIDLLGALEASRQEAGAGSGQISASPSDEADVWLGMDTVPPLSYPDLARPPPLPSRPLPLRTISGPGYEIVGRLAKSSSASPIHSSRTSRSPSPAKKMKMKATLRPLRPPRTPSSSDTRQTGGSTRPPAASKAATQAWTSITRSDGNTTPLQAEFLAKDRSKPMLAENLTGQPLLKQSLSARRESSNNRNAFLNPRRTTSNNYRIADESDDSKSPTRTRKHPQDSMQATRNLTSSSSNNQGALTLSKNTSNHHRPRVARSPEPTLSSRFKQSKVPGADMYPAQSDADNPSIVIRRKPINLNASTPRSRNLLHGDICYDKNTDESDTVSRSEDEPTEIDELEAESKELEAESKELSWLSASNRVLSNLPRSVDQHVAEQILNEVVIHGDEVHWSDIAGLDIAKTALKENVVYPFLRPDLFRGLREPARGILLFGPPGTGKTMLARAVACESSSTFFAISASSLISKYLGESEKLVRGLFAIAKQLAPSVIFVDEIDSLLSSRSESGEHETSRRIKTEFLIQWSDLARAAAGRDAKSKSKSADAGDASRVLVLAATNAPWMIDEAARRRFVRRQYIPLPEAEVRGRQIKTLLENQTHDLREGDVQRLISLTEGFSGSDITSLAKDAAMGPLRSLGDRLLLTKPEDIRSISLRDFEASLLTIRPSVSKEGLQQFDDWAKQYGERGG